MKSISKFSLFCAMGLMAAVPATAAETTHSSSKRKSTSSQESKQAHGNSTKASGSKSTPVAPTLAKVNLSDQKLAKELTQFLVDDYLKPMAAGKADKIVAAWDPSVIVAEQNMLRDTGKYNPKTQLQGLFAAQHIYADPAPIPLRMQNTENTASILYQVRAQVFGSSKDSANALMSVTYGRRDGKWRLLGMAFSKSDGGFMSIPSIWTTGANGENEPVQDIATMAKQSYGTYIAHETLPAIPAVRPVAAIPAVFVCCGCDFSVNGQPGTNTVTGRSALVPGGLIRGENTIEITPSSSFGTLTISDANPKDSQHPKVYFEFKDDGKSEAGKPIKKTFKMN